MVRSLSLALLLGALTFSTGLADDPETGSTAPEPGPDASGYTPVFDHPLLDSVPPFRTTALAAEPTDGGMQPSRGYPHYELPSRHYGVWFRPSSFGRQAPQRCTPACFNPRGYGRLFARSCVGYRMDYEPFALPSEANAYGPAYLADPDPYKCIQKRLFGNRCRH